MADKSNTAHRPAAKRRGRQATIHIADFENEHLDEDEDPTIKTESNPVPFTYDDDEEENEGDEENYNNMEVERDKETLNKVNSDKVSDIVISLILKNVS